MKIAIIGNGIAGVTAARHIRKNTTHAITIISSESTHFFSRTALMYIYMGHMKYEHTKPYEDSFWVKNQIDLIHDHVNHIDFAAKTLHLAKGQPFIYDQLILATGSIPNKFGWPGENLTGVQGLYSLQDLAAMEAASKDGLEKAVIVGGGLIGIEMAEMFHSRHIPVTFLVRESSFWNNILPEKESEMINRHIREHEGINLRLGETLREILPDENGKVKAVITGSGEEIACQFVGLTAGVSPNINFLRGSSLETNRGILINNFFETNLPGVYAIGDCAEFREPLPDRRAIEQVWYTGRMHGETVAQTISGKRTPYTPGPWFNSAKFFDIEYQTYGHVPTELPPNLTSLYWEAPNGKKCIHLVYEKESGRVLGSNYFGIRSRHVVWDKWLQEGRDIHFVLENLSEANFDAEFSVHYEPILARLYNQQHSDRQPVRVKRKKRLREWF